MNVTTNEKQSKAIEKGKIKGIEDVEIDKFFRELLEKIDKKRRCYVV